MTATATVSPGSLTLSTSATPSLSATLDGTDQTPTYSLPMSVNDYTGSGNGWNVTVTSTTFSTGGGSPHLVSATASTATGVTASCAGGATCTAPTNSITVTPTFQVAIPANTYAGRYTGTVTAAVVSGP